MKNEFTTEFFNYIDENLSRKEVADSLGNSTKTLSSWRSIGIPEGKIYACKSVIATHKAGLSEPHNVIVMKPSYAQFQTWNKAALERNLTIEDWAFEGLEAIAQAHFSKSKIVAYFTNPEPQQMVGEQNTFNSDPPPDPLQD